MRHGKQTAAQFHPCSCQAGIGGRVMRLLVWTCEVVFPHFKRRPLRLASQVAPPCGRRGCCCCCSLSSYLEQANFSSRTQPRVYRRRRSGPGSLRIYPHPLILSQSPLLPVLLRGSSARHSHMGSAYFPRPRARAEKLVCGPPRLTDYSNGAGDRAESAPGPPPCAWERLIANRGGTGVVRRHYVRARRYRARAVRCACGLGQRGTCGYVL
ncbi:hypothetical protein C8Q77DRAFT_1105005 [Trametes polyzona]|nr:hypothetical protein C8Q77DRAFT_1105005 [Trametes polyzona]